MSRNVLPRLTLASAGCCFARYAECVGDLLKRPANGPKLPHGDNAVAGQPGVKVLLTLRDDAKNVAGVDAVAAVGDIFQIVDAVVGRNAILVVDAKAIGARPNERGRNEPVNAEMAKGVITAQSNIQMAGTLPTGSDDSRRQCAGALAVLVFDRAGHGTDSPAIRYFVKALKSWYGQPTLNAIRILLSHDSHLVCGLWLEPADVLASVRLASF